MSFDVDPMTFADFAIGKEFKTGFPQANGSCKVWRCTDVGTRVITAIALDMSDVSWYDGPPYAVAEYVFDEYDIDGCYALDGTEVPIINDDIVTMDADGVTTVWHRGKSEQNAARQ